jgi:hypothetical protein
MKHQYHIYFSTNPQFAFTMSYFICHMSYVICHIRMALEVVVLIAAVTGRVLVLPPHAVLYLLTINKKWGDNRSGAHKVYAEHAI